MKSYPYLLVGLLIAGCSSLKPEPPVIESVKTWEQHIELKVDQKPSLTPVRYRIYRREGDRFIPAGVSETAAGYVQVWRQNDQDTGGTYYLRRLSSAGIESGNSKPVSAGFRSMTDDEWLDMVQMASFRFFYDFGHPVSGLALERFPVDFDDVVTSGGTGFGLMGFPVAVERGWITRNEALERIQKMVTFLGKADRFHGAWSHWLTGTDGKAYPFSKMDNGGDLVETAYLIQGLLTVRHYFSLDTPAELKLREDITRLWETVDWAWYLRYPDSKILYWHWSPDYSWEMNFPLVNWNEVMITYLLAIASPTHPIPAESWAEGWQSGKHLNGNTFYGLKLEVGWDHGGPLFFTHYSFLGFDPRNLRDNLTNYFENNRTVALIHQRYAAENPKNYPGYSAESWGLTASDNPWGYGAQEPVKEDNGTISPTAALSSFAYTPQESMAALKNFYRTHKGKLWGEFGFRDAFNLKEKWYAPSVISIDQGPIICMIENHRTGLLWNLFMQNPEIAPMLKKAGFKPDPKP